MRLRRLPACPNLATPTSVYRRCPSIGADMSMTVLGLTADHLLTETSTITDVYFGLLL